MFAARHQFFAALNNAAKAARRQDLAEAERWVKLAERHVAIYERLQEITNPRPSANGRPAWLRNLA